MFDHILLSVPDANEIIIDLLHGYLANKTVLLATCQTEILAHMHSAVILLSGRVGNEISCKLLQSSKMDLSSNSMVGEVGGICGLCRGESKIVKDRAGLLSLG